MAPRTTPGIRVRHSRTCKIHSGGNCNCEPSIEAWVYSKRDGKKIRKTFTGRGAMTAAKGWRVDATKLVKDKRLRAPTSRTLQQEVDDWLAGVREGRILNKREQSYKPAAIRNYELALRLRVLPELGSRKLADIDFSDLLELKERLQGEGHSGSTIRNTFVPLQAIYRRARRTGLVQVNPTLDLGLPTSGTRERAAMPAEAAELLEPLADLERALWGTAFYAGLRRGELRALRVRDLDLGADTISVERGWDDKEGAIEPKSRAGKRKVFVLAPLKPLLEPLVENRGADELVFGSGPASAFDPRAVARKAVRAWDAEDKKRTERQVEENPEQDPVLLPERFTLHEARHSFSTWLDHAGVSGSRADRYMGHSDGSVAGRYRHQLPGQLAEDAKLVDAYLAGAVAGKVVAIVATG
jgi:integrase